MSKSQSQLPLHMVLCVWSCCHRNITQVPLFPHLLWHLKTVVGTITYGNTTCHDDGFQNTGEKGNLQYLLSVQWTDIPPQLSYQFDKIQPSLFCLSTKQQATHFDSNCVSFCLLVVSTSLFSQHLQVTLSNYLQHCHRKKLTFCCT